MHDFKLSFKIYWKWLISQLILCPDASLRQNNLSIHSHAKRRRLRPSRDRLRYSESVEMRPHSPIATENNMYCNSQHAVASTMNRKNSCIQRGFCSTYCSWWTASSWNHHTNQRAAILISIQNHKKTSSTFFLKKIIKEIEFNKSNILIGARSRNRTDTSFHYRKYHLSNNSRNNCYYDDESFYFMGLEFQDLVQ